MTGHEMMGQLAACRHRCEILDTKLAEVTEALVAALDREEEGSREMTDVEIDGQALRLREFGMPYSWIALVMREYHGVDFTRETWSSKCRALGAPSAAKGASFGSALRAELVGP